MFRSFRFSHCPNCPNSNTYLLLSEIPSSLRLLPKRMASTTASTVSATGSPDYAIVERGQLYSLDYRVYFTNTASGQMISPWHDVPLFAHEVGDWEFLKIAHFLKIQEFLKIPLSFQTFKHYNMIVEIPRWSNAKMEIATKEAGNPIKQDVKSGQPRYVHNVFPHKGYIWNYGALPQTWENPEHKDENTKAMGDNDPIDVVEIGQVVHARGDVVAVKVAPNHFCLGPPPLYELRCSAVWPCSTRARPTGSWWPST